MHEFRPMSVLHADLVVPLLVGQNSQNQRGFQYILSAVDSATRYLWLLPIHHIVTQDCRGCGHSSIWRDHILRFGSIHYPYG